MEQKKTPVVIMRGGTSKGIYIKKEDLPENKQDRDELILKIFGSPDIRQINGLGGADPLTSKLAIIGPPSRSDADVDYTFGQVSYTDAKIDYSGNCGNISSGVGPFAIDEGYVKAEGPSAVVRVHNTNTGKILIENVEVINGKAKVTGNYKISGVPGTGSEIIIDFSDTAGSATGKLLPTGNVIDKISVTGYGNIEVSLVDAANPVVFLRAKDLGLTGIETPSQIDENKDMLNTLEEIRAKGAVLMGLIKDWKDAVKEIPAFPMVAFVSPAQDYVDFTSGKNISENDTDFVSRLMYMQIMHKTYAGTATTCTGAAARIEGTIVNEAMNAKGKGKNSVLRIGHPAGVITVDAIAHKSGDSWKLERAAISRTSRRIMQGNCFTV